MPNINYIALHHSGGLGNNNYASTAHLTVEDVERGHKNRWFFKSSLGRYGGYNCIYDPKTRQFTQYRAIGEETAAQKGFNFNTFSLCVIGNYIKHPVTGKTVDTMTKQIESDVAAFLSDLIGGNKRGLKLAPNTTLDLSVARINPHRFYQPDTQCNGSLPDNWGRTIVLRHEYSNNPLVRQIVDLFYQLKIITAPMPDIWLGSEFDRACCGFINN